MSERAVERLSCAMIALWALVAFVIARDKTASNYNIYRAVAERVNETGALPVATDRLRGDVAGYYADFTAPSLWLYRVLFAPSAPWAQKALYLGWQAVVFGLGVIVLLRCRERLGLSAAMAQAVAVLVASPLLSGYLMVFLEDKALFFTGPVLALAVTARWWRAALFGLVAGWTGAFATALVLLGRRDRRLDLPGLVAGAAVFAAVTFGAAAGTWTLLANRSVRESSDPFWFSLWRVASIPEVARAAVLLVVAALVVWGWWRRRVSDPATVAALVALVMLSSVNTVPSRIAPVVVLGALTARGVWRSRYLAGAAVWLAVMFGAALVGRVVDLDVFVAPPPTMGVSTAVQVLIVNAPLLLVVASAAAAGVGVRRSGQQDPERGDARVRHH